MRIRWAVFVGYGGSDFWEAAVILFDSDKIDTLCWVSSWVDMNVAQATVAGECAPCCALSPGVLADAVQANPLLGLDPPWSFWEAETQKHSRLGNLRHGLFASALPSDFNTSVLRPLHRRCA